MQYSANPNSPKFAEFDAEIWIVPFATDWRGSGVVVSEQL